MSDTTSAPPPIRWHDPALWLATCGGIGRVGVAPGTFGSVVGVPLSLAVGWLANAVTSRLGGGGWLPTVVEGALVAAICFAAVPVCTRAVRLLGRGDDPGAIVLDEAAALPLALLAVPFTARSWTVLVAGFLLFRLFDIWKPVPCRQLESLPGGLGIMADDWGAAAWAAGCLVIARGQGWV